MISREKKQEIIKKLTEKLTKQKIVVFSDYTGLKAGQLKELRDKLREEGIDYCVAKKTLIDLALAKSGLKKIETKKLTGQIGLAFGYDDKANPAKLLFDFSKDNEALKILAGLINQEYLNQESVLTLAKLPSKSELLANLVRSISGPLASLVYQLKGNLNQFIHCLKTIKQGD